MARVPTLDNFSVAPSTGGQRNVSAPAVVPAIGEQLQQFGRATQQAGDVASRIMLDQQQEANRLRVTDAINRAKEEATRLTFDKDAGFRQQKGIAALERQSGKTLTDDYSETLAKQFDAIQQGLGNDAQRQAFAEAGRGLMAGFRGDLTRHEADEFQTYATSVDEGATTNALNDMGLYWNDPARLQSAADTVKASTNRLRLRLGKSAEWGEARTRELLSNGHMSAIGAAIENDDISYAEGYLSQFGDQMTAQDRLRVDGLIGKRQDALVATTVASEIFSGASVAPPSASQFAMPVRGQITSPFGQRAAPTAGASRNHNGVDIAVPIGTPVAAPAGGEIIASGYDDANGNFVRIRHDDGTVTGYAHLSTRELQKGDRVDAGQVFAKSGNTGRSTGPHLHYTMKVDGVNVDPTAPRKAPKPAGSAGRGLLEMIQMVRADPRVAGNPERMQEAEQQVRSLYAAREEGDRERKEQTQMAVYEKLYSNGGNLQSLTAAERQALGPGGLSSAMSFANQVQAERRGDNKPDIGLWADLKLNPDKLSAMSPSELQRLAPRLGREAFRDLVTDRATATEADPSKVAVQTQKARTTALRDIKGEMAAAGLDTSPKPGSKEATAFGQFQAAYATAIDAEQRVLGDKPITVQRAREIGRALLAEEATTKRSWFGLGGQINRRTFVGATELPPLSAIRPDVQNAIVQSLRRRLGPGTRITQRMVREEYAAFAQE